LLSVVDKVSGVSSSKAIILSRQTDSRTHAREYVLLWAEVTLAVIVVTFVGTWILQVFQIQNYLFVIDAKLFTILLRCARMMITPSLIRLLVTV